MDMRTDKVDLGLAWRNDFSRLGPQFSTPLRPTPLPSPYWVAGNAAVARELGLDPDWLSQQAGAEALTGNLGLLGSAPLASVYSGHQFGVWAGQLGDGRAILLGETEAGLELQLKGSGPTPYSRMGDGRAVLRSSIREFLCSAAMQGLGIPTTLALSVTGSDAPVRREEVETAAVVARVAPSFIRFGHFEHFAANGQIDALRQLADFVIDRHYPGCRASADSAGNPYAALLQAVSDRTATMVAQWQAVGFCHGVMNTDNMSILGLTIDYGPFQFLDAFDPGHVCNHSDAQGRYAYNKQPNVAYWNLFCLGQALLPLIEKQELALAALESYKTAFPRALEAAMRAKLGLLDEQDGDRGLIESVLQLLAGQRIDYTIFWHRLGEAVTSAAAGPAGGSGIPSDGRSEDGSQSGSSMAPVRDLFTDRGALDRWLSAYEIRLAAVDRRRAGALMQRSNPKFILRNHLAEQAIRSAKLKDYSEVHTLLALLQTPFDEHPGFDSYAGFPPEWASQIEISCSS